MDKNREKQSYCKYVLEERGLTQVDACKILTINITSLYNYMVGRMNSKRLDEYFGWKEKNNIY